MATGHGGFTMSGTEARQRAREALAQAKARVAALKQVDPFFLDLSLGEAPEGAWAEPGHAVTAVGRLDAAGLYTPSPCQEALRGLEVPSIVKEVYLAGAGMRGRYDHETLRRSLPESVMWLMENVRGEKGGAPRIYIHVPDGSAALAEAPEETLAILELLAGLPLEGVALADDVPDAVTTGTNMSIDDAILAEDIGVYKTLLESTRAIPWKIEWATLRFAYIGPQIEELLGWSPQSWQTVQDWADRMHPEDREWVFNFCVSQSQAGIDHEADYRALRKDGEFVWIRDVVHVVRNDDGTPNALIGFMFDISERKRTEEKLLDMQRELEELSFKDGLTGVANRRRFDNVVEARWRDARQNRQPLSVVVLDIDYFKQYNDHYGHLEGDECLKRVARALSGSARNADDLLCRFGGEEFVLLLPNTDEAAAMAMAWRCLDLVDKALIPHAGVGHDKRLTLSAGVNTLVPGEGDSVLPFIGVADSRLYKAKERGRHRVVAEG
ncbi:diguanylate cyclase (GGDEF)-like protein/PAS domain S-box-containing protein [Luteibacter sp. 621]